MGLLNPKFIDEMRRRTGDPMLDLRYNPTIGRWIVVQDLSLSRRPDVWRRTAKDLVGVPGVHPHKTQLVRLFRLEDHGMPIVPNIEWIMRELHVRSRIQQDDKAFEDVMAQTERDDAERMKTVRAKLEDDAEVRWGLFKKRNYSYAGQSNRTGLS